MHQPGPYLAIFFVSDALTSLGQRDVSNRRDDFRHHDLLVYEAGFIAGFGMKLAFIMKNPHSFFLQLRGFYCRFITNEHFPFLKLMQPIG